MWGSRWRFPRLKYRPIAYISLLVCVLLLAARWKGQNNGGLSSSTDVQRLIDRVRDMPISDQNSVLTIVHAVTGDAVPKWVNWYNVSHLFDFYWLQNGAYRWHQQRLLSIQQESNDRERRFQQVVLEHSNDMDMLNHLEHHPEYGIILDRAPDPVQPLFPPLPLSSSSLTETCEHYSWMKHWYPCRARSEMIPSRTTLHPITYALYDVTVKTHMSTAKTTADYDELIYLFESHQQKTNETYFVRQVLPRLVRLLALAPLTACVVVPHASSTPYVRQYLNVLIDRGLVANGQRFLAHNSSQVYRANALYSTSSPRSDLALLHRILAGNQTANRTDLILIIRDGLDDYSYNEIAQIIAQFEFPDNLAHLRVQEYNETAYNLTQIQDQFRRAHLVIGMPTNALSHIIWCQPRAHVIEIVRRAMTTDFYEMSVQLGLTYWLAKSTSANLVDVIDFRNLMMQILVNMDA